MHRSSLIISTPFPQGLPLKAEESCLPLEADRDGSRCGAVKGDRAERRSILRSHTYRMHTLLGGRGVVDHQHGSAAAD